MFVAVNARVAAANAVAPTAFAIAVFLGLRSAVIPLSESLFSFF